MCLFPVGGRGYISQSPGIIQALLYLMYGEEGGDTHTRRNCLGAIQKLSLRYKNLSTSPHIYNHVVPLVQSR